MQHPPPLPFTGPAGAAALQAGRFLYQVMSVEMHARGVCQDPFRGGDNILVMADAYEPPRDTPQTHVDMKPIPTNTRYACAEVMKKTEAEEPWFGIEQVGHARGFATC